MRKKELFGLYCSLESVANLFAVLEAGGPEDGRTTADDLCELCDLARPDAISLLRDLADCGCGEFRVGRRGHPSRLEWSIDVVETAKGLRAQAQAQALEQARESVGNDAPLDAALSDSESAKLAEHAYLLRPELRLVFELPLDLTKREAEVLADWVRNLSFDRHC